MSWHKRFRPRFGVRAHAAVVAALCALLVAVPAPSSAQVGLLHFPPRPPPQPKKPPPPSNAPMLVQAAEIRYDYTNNTVAAVGNVQIYYAGSTVEADQVIYDQKSKRLRAEGNVRLTEPDGKITYGQVIDLTDDYRDGFIDSLRLETADDTYFAAARADRARQLHGSAKWHLYRLRAVQGRPAKTAALAGQGRPHHS